MKHSSPLLLAFACLGLLAPAERADSNTDSATGQILDCKELDTPPKVLRSVRPLYPAELKKAAIAGEAVIGLLVDAQGAVREVEVVRCTQAAFGDAARAAIEQWQFSPGMKNGNAVSTRLQVPIVFQPEPAAAKPGKS